MNSAGEKVSIDRVSVNHVPQKTPVTRARRNSSTKFVSLLSSLARLSARNRAHDEKRLGTFCNRIGQGSIRWFVGDVFAAREKSHQRPALFCFVIADGAAQHRI